MAYRQCHADEQHAEQPDADRAHPTRPYDKELQRQIGETPASLGEFDERIREGPQADGSTWKVVGQLGESTPHGSSQLGLGESANQQLREASGRIV